MSDEIFDCAEVVEGCDNPYTMKFRMHTGFLRAYADYLDMLAKQHPDSAFALEMRIPEHGIPLPLFAIVKIADSSERKEHEKTDHEDL